MTLALYITSDLVLSGPGRRRKDPSAVGAGIDSLIHSLVSKVVVQASQGAPNEEPPGEKTRWWCELVSQLFGILSGHARQEDTKLKQGTSWSKSAGTRTRGEKVRKVEGWVGRQQGSSFLGGTHKTEGFSFAFPIWSAPKCFSMSICSPSLSP